MHWMNDSSSGSAKTGRFLDNCLAIAESADRMLFARRSAANGEDGENAPQGT
jgi:hypothetical protein